MSTKLVEKHVQLCACADASGNLVQDLNHKQLIGYRQQWLDHWLQTCCLSIVAFSSETHYQKRSRFYATTRLSYNNRCNKNHTCCIYRHAPRSEASANKNKFERSKSLYWVWKHGNLATDSTDQRFSYQTKTRLPSQ